VNVFILDADVNKYRGIYYADDETVVEFNQRFDGRPMKLTWTGKEEFHYVTGRLREGDTPGLSSHIPVFNAKAVEVLKDLLEPNGELLPIACDGVGLFLFNVTRFSDALDEANCDLVRFDDGRIMIIDRYSFIKAELVGEIAFKLRQEPLSWVYVTDPFVERVRVAKLKGFEFRLVWSSQ